MREVFAILELASPTEATVLIQGESGTGKELVARAIHDHSTRSGGPFVVVDCSAAKEQLIESDFFGHRQGAFTGASHDRKGAFVEARGGTVFLDEIGELPAASQAKLLRAIEARTVKPLGSDREVEIDVRILAATHRDLRTMVAQGSFRFDLFHRMAVVHVVLPPLRERLDDLPGLIRHFYEGSAAGDIAGENLKTLQHHAWPGNVRELRNVLERSTVLSRPGAGFAELNLWLDSESQSRGSTAFVDLTQPFKEAKEAWNDVFERRYVDAVIRRHNGNVSRAAEAAGLSRRHLRTLLVKHGLADDE